MLNQHLSRTVWTTSKHHQLHEVRIYCWTFILGCIGFSLVCLINHQLSVYMYWFTHWNWIIRTGDVTFSLAIFSSFSCVSLLLLRSRCLISLTRCFVVCICWERWESSTTALWTPLPFHPSGNYSLDYSLLLWSLLALPPRPPHTHTLTCVLQL